MNYVDIIVVVIVLTLLILAIRSSRKQKCNGHCSACASGCSSHKQPEFVRRYREDHPKQIDQ